MRLSVSELPLSEPGFRTGVEGAVGGVSSRSLMARETDCSEELLPAASVATTVKE